MPLDTFAAIATYAGPFAGMLAVWYIIARPMLNSAKAERGEWLGKMDKFIESIERNSEATRELTQKVNEGHFCFFAVRGGFEPPPGPAPCEKPVTPLKTLRRGP